MEFDCNLHPIWIADYFYNNLYSMVNELFRYYHFINTLTADFF